MQLTDLLVTQDNVDLLSREFGLSEEQTLEAMGALLPAFSVGLKRNVATPQGTAQFLQALAGGNHHQYVDDPALATSQSGIDDGNAILGHVFGNKDVSRAIASQAAASTGIGPSILKQMLPTIASMIMGSLFKGAVGGGLGRTMGSAAGGGLLGQIIEGLAGGALSGGREATRPRRRRTRARGGSPLEDLLGGALGGAMGGELGDLLGGMLGGGANRSGRQTQRRRPRSRAPAPSPRRTRRRRQGNMLEDLLGGTKRRAPARTRRRAENGGLGDIFGDILEPGGNSTDEYRQSTKSVFDDLLGPG